MDIFDIAVAKALCGGSGGGGGGGATPIVITPNDPTAPSDTEVWNACTLGTPVILHVDDESYDSYETVTWIYKDKNNNNQIFIYSGSGTYFYASGTGWTSY